MKRILVSILAVACAALFSLMAVACTPLAALVSVESLSVSESTVSIVVGGTVQLTATVTPPDATNTVVSWSSSAEGVATVTDAGLVTGVSAGTATVVVTTADGGKTAACAVTVSAEPIHVTSVSLNKTATGLLIGGTEQLVATVLPANSTHKAVTWSSSNEGLATVSSTGLVEGKAAGAAVITVTTTDGGKTAACAVTVSAEPIHVTSVSLNKTYRSLRDGATYQLEATVLPLNATDPSVTWTSSDGVVATVSGNGLVTAEAAGSAVITVTTTDGSKTASCSVWVYPDSPTVLYVAEGSTAHQVSVFNAADTANGTGVGANRVLAYTGFGQLTGVRRDTTKDILYVLNQTAGCIYVFDNGSTVTGNQAPDRTITSTSISQPYSFQIDEASDRLFVSNYATGGTTSTIAVFDSASTLDGSVPLDRELTGSGVADAHGIYLDTTNDRLYVARGGSSSSIAVFNNTGTITGALTPDRVINVVDSSVDLVLVHVDVTRNVLYTYSTDSYYLSVLQNADTISGFSTPEAAFSPPYDPGGIFVDTVKDMLFVSGILGTTSSILVYDCASGLSGSPVPDRIFGTLTDPAGLWGE